MSTQYNTIQAPYDYIRTKTVAIVERENVRTTLQPYIQDAKVLEFACGSGFYTHAFLKWGASSVVGVDISSAMVEQAKRHPSAAANLDSGKLKFILADCSKPIAYEGGPFDIIFGAWLLNYAPDRAGLLDMFRNIALNLRPGGHFVSVTIPPTEGPVEAIEAELRVRPPPEGSGGLYYPLDKVRNVEDGVLFTCLGHTPHGDVSFDNYLLKKSVYEAAAREAGLKELRWGRTEVPEAWLKEGKWEGGATREELESYREVTNYGILVLEK